MAGTPRAGRVVASRERVCTAGARAGDLEHEHHPGDLDGIPGRRRGFLGALAVEDGAVGAAQVLELEAVAVADNAAVLARGLAEGDAQVAVLPAAHHGPVAHHGETA